MTLRGRLTAAFLVVVIVPLLVGAALVAAALPRAVADRQERGVVSAGHLSGQVIGELCKRARAAAEVAARAAVTPDPVAIEAALSQLVDRGLADGASVVDGSGATVAMAGTGPTNVLSQGCEAGEVVRKGSENFLTATVRLERPVPGSPVPQDAGAASASFRIADSLARRLRAALGDGEIVLLAGGQRIAESGPVDAELITEALEAGNRPVHTNGSLAAIDPVRPGQPVAVLVAMPEGEGVNVLPYVLGVVGLAAALAAGIAVLLARATTRPLQELGDAAARIASGDLTATIAVRNRDEIGRLAEAFNAMIEELRGYVGALQKSRDEVQATVARLGDALSGTHDLDRILGVVLDTAMASTGAHGGAVLLLSGDHLELAAGEGLAEHDVPADLRLEVGTGIAGGVARSGVPVRGYSGKGLRPAPGEPRNTTLAALPLKSSADVVGVLMLFDRDEEFSEGDLTTLRAFASQATVAIDNVQLHEEARRQSLTDGLTGLWNYRYFQLTVGKEIERASRFSRPLSLLMLDLDLFKRVNDNYGHQRGDDVLVELAERLRGQVRDVDVLARYGGEEFVAVLPETDEAGALQAAERIRAAVRRAPFGDGDDPLDMTVSIGVAVFPQHGDSSADLLGRADEAMYAAKRAGRDTFRVYDPDGVRREEPEAEAESVPDSGSDRDPEITSVRVAQAGPEQPQQPT